MVPKDRVNGETESVSGVKYCFKLRLNLTVRLSVSRSVASNSLQPSSL